MRAILPFVESSDFPALTRGPLETLQVNLGYRCNQQCQHCHVNAGPKRTEQMARDTVDLVLAVLRMGKAAALDLTGGAPELNPHFRHLVTGARAVGVRVIDRCNLTILEEPGQEDLARFLATQRVEIVASLPCYLAENVDRQRGEGTFDRSLRALRQLNALGYGVPSTGLQISLVYNPQGPSLPPPQPALEADYRRHLLENYGVRFTRLLTLSNMPIQRFGSMLISRGQFHEYLSLLKGAHEIANLDHVMCRRLVSVDWEGRLFDCDFNQMLGLPLEMDGQALRLADLLARDIEGLPIMVADHCYGCTAGQGSSCGGALNDIGPPAVCGSQ